MVTTAQLQLDIFPCASTSLDSVSLAYLRYQTDNSLSIGTPQLCGWDNG
jgi:hypothetical protein